MNTLSSDDKQLQALAAKLDPSHSASIARYGTSVQRKLSTFTDRALRSVTAGDFGEIGALLSQMAATITALDQALGAKAPLFPRSAKKRSAALRIQFQTATNTLDTLQKELLGQHTALLVNLCALNDLYQQNLDFHQELTLYLAAGRQKLAELDTPDCSHQGCHGPPGSADQIGHGPLGSADPARQDAPDFANQRRQLEQRLHDLELTRTICLQTAAQIQLVQKTQSALAEQIASSLHQAIPLWKQKLAIALALEQNRSAETTILDLQAARLSTSELVALIRDTQALEATERQHQASAALELNKAHSDLSSHARCTQPFAH